MITYILTRSGLKTNEGYGYLLMKAALLFSDKVLFANCYNIFITAEDDLARITDPLNKLNHIASIMNHVYSVPDPEMKKLVYEAIDAFKMIKSYGHTRNMRQVRSIMRMRGSVSDAENVYIKESRKLRDIYKLDEIMKLNRQGRDRIAGFLHYNEPDPEKPVSGKSINELSQYSFIINIVKHNTGIPVLYPECMETKLYKAEFDPDAYNGELVVFDPPLFSLPSTDTLTTEQIKITRQEFISSFRDLYLFIDNFIADNQNKREPGAAGILTDCQKKLLGDLTGKCRFQYIIDESIYIKYARSNSKSGDKESCVHLGICSLNTLLKLYRELGIIDPPFELYMREQEFRDKDLNLPYPIFVIKLSET